MEAQAQDEKKAIKLKSVISEEIKTKMTVIEGKDD